MVVAALLVACSSVFLLGLTHKVRVAVSGQADAHPVLTASPLLRRWPRTALLVAAAADLVGIVLAWIAPLVGLVWLIALLGAYSLAVSRIADGQDCDCLGAYAPAADRNAALIRNALLGVGLATAAVLAVVDQGPALGPASAALALVILAPAGGIAAHRQLAGLTGGDRASRI
jgi:hypothetical protein